MNIRQPWSGRAIACLGMMLAAQALAAPVIPGLQGKHGLDAAQAGQVLVEELRCGACHEGFPRETMRAAPDLARVAARVRPGFIARMIGNPADAHPGTTMPQTLAAESPEKRREIAESITAYLLSLSNESPPSKSKATTDAKEGAAVFHRVGCVACHSPRDQAGRETDPDGVVRLDHVGAKYTKDSLAKLLLDPLATRPSGRMPDLRLTPGEAGNLAAFLIGEAKETDVRPKSDPELVNAGRERFKALNCVACHQLGDEAVVHVAPARAELDATRGCLSPAPISAPDFSLSSEQRESIRAFLRQLPDQKTDVAQDVFATLAKFNCLACHERDGHGGVAADRDVWFHTTEEGLGNAARIPPPLTLAGAKLRGEWMSQVLLEGRSVRPYMSVRMPRFGPSVRDLPALFAEVDFMEPVELPEPARDERRLFRDEARKLLGDRGLNCVACHNFNGKDSPGFKGLDLMTTFQRLQPAWFVAYLKDPLAFRPGTVMPAYWPGGKAVHTEILGGDTAKQLRAIWHFLSLGHSAPDPSGIRSEPTALLVKDRARTYRGRNRTAGFRGIAVGFPGGLNYSFNAEYGSLVAVWQGDFVTANWRGQAAGDFNAAGREIILAKDVSLARLENDAARWPLRPIIPKDEPLNPDPLYPKNRGYAFRGYFFDDADIPTFLYAVGNVEVQDKTVAVDRAGRQALRRTLTFDSPAPTTLYFRAAAGRIEAVSERGFRLGQLRVSMDSGQRILRSSTENPGEQEWLVKLNLARGETQLRLEYELEDRR